MSSNVRVCNKCKRSELEVAFYNSRKTICKPCNAKVADEYRKRTDANRKYYKENQEAQKARSAKYYHTQKYYQANKQKWRGMQLMTKYGITLQDYYDMLGHQNHKCKICETPHIEEKKKGLYVDHCHTTGNIRGLLCHNCNVGLGALRDSEDLMLKAIDYLKKSKELK